MANDSDSENEFTPKSREKYLLKKEAVLQQNKAEDFFMKRFESDGDVEKFVEQYQKRHVRITTGETVKVSFH